MSNREAIETIKIAIAEVEWNYPMEYAVAFEIAIEALEKQIYSCKDCRHADYMSRENAIYCLEHSCMMSCDNCCRDWRDAVPITLLR